MENQTTETVEAPNIQPDVWGTPTPDENQPSQVMTPTEEVKETLVETPTPETKVTPTEEVKTEVTPAQEKIVEKIVEKYPEFKDDYSKQIYQSILDGKEEELKSYFDEKFRDYNVISDRENIEYKLKKENPTWNDKDIAGEIKFKYGSNFDKIDLDAIDQELDPDKYNRAVAHNDDVERRELMLERDGRDSRLWNNEQKKSIELPKIPVTEQAPQATQLTQEEIDESNRKWEESVSMEVPKVEDLKFDVNGEEVVYKITDQDKGALTETMKNFEVVDYLTKRGWFDADGIPNVKAITEDVYKLDNMGKIVASTSTQMKTSAKKEVVADIKNLNLSPETKSPEQSADVASLIWGQ